MPISTTPLYTELDGSIDTSVASLITINHGLIRAPDQYTIYCTDPDVGGVTFTLVSKSPTQIVFEVHGPRQVLNWRAIITVNHSIIDGHTAPGNVSYATSGVPAGSSSGYTPSGSTIQERGLTTNLVLDDGRVMVLGGSLFDGIAVTVTPSDKVDLWDPVSKTWSPLASLPAPRIDCVAVFLRHGPEAGKVLVAGGFDPDSLDFDTIAAASMHDDAWLYDFATDIWTPTGSLPTPSTGTYVMPSTVELQDGRVLFVGGPQAATWLPGPPWPAGQGGPAAAAVYAWTPLTGVWAAVAPMTQARCFHTATLLQDGRVLVVGGRDYFNNATVGGVATYLDTYEIYNPTTDTWTAPVVLPTISDGPTGFEKASREGDVPFYEVSGPKRGIHYAHRLNDGRVLIIGGVGELSTDPTVAFLRRGCLIFDPNTDTFSIGPNAIRSQAIGVHCTLRGGWVLLAGGEDESNPFSEFGSPTTQIFSPDDDSWRQLADVPAAFLDRVGIFCAALCNSRGDVIITGGFLPIGPTFTGPNVKTLLYNPVLPFVRSQSE